MRIVVLGVPVVIDFSSPLSEQELQEASEAYNWFYNNGYYNSDECMEMETAMGSGGYTLTCSQERGTFYWIAR